MCPLQGGHRGARTDGGGAGYCMSAMGAAGKPAGQVLHLNRILIGQRASYEGGDGRKSTAISFRPQGGSLPVSQLGKLRHQGEGSPLACLQGHRPGRGQCGWAQGDEGGRQGPVRPTTTTYVSSMASRVGSRGSAQWHGFGLDEGPAPGPPGPGGGAARVTSWTRGASAPSPAGRGLLWHWARPSPCGPGWAQWPGWRAWAPGAAWSCWLDARRLRGQGRERHGAARAVRQTAGARRGSGGALEVQAQHGAQLESRVRHHRAKSVEPEDWWVRLGDWQQVRDPARQWQQTQAPGVGAAQGGAS